MHYIRLVDSIVLKFPSPITINSLHPYFHKLLKSSSLEEAQAILDTPYSSIFYLYDAPAIVEFPSETVHHGSLNTGKLLATFTSLEECYNTYPEYFI